MTDDRLRTHSLHPLGHEVLYRNFPMVRGLVDMLVEEAEVFGAIDRGALSPRRLMGLPAIGIVTERMLRESILEFGSEDYGLALAAEIGMQLHYAVNFELNRRKVFWVDEALAWMLLHTNLDIEGRALELPFPSFAVALQDEACVALLREHLRKDPSFNGDPDSANAVTIYVTRGERTDTGQDLELSFVVDRGGCEHPYVSIRSLHIRADDDIERILHSSGSDVEQDTTTDPRITPELTRLVHVVINAILYATSAPPSDGWPVAISPSAAVMRKARAVGPKRQKRAATRAAALSATHSGELVFHLAGKISISRLRAMRDVERHDAGGRLFSRFMVRGHWRRPPTRWADQRLRWIEPYWKGPEIATVIEREYRLAI